MKPFFYSFSIVLFLAVSSCNNKMSEHRLAENKHIADSVEAAKPKFIRHYPDFNLQTLKDSLKTCAQTDSALFAYFSASGFTPFWIKDTLDVESLQTLSSLFANVDQHGLPNELFPGWEMVSSITDSVNNGAYIGKPESLYHNLAVLNKLTFRLMSNFITGMTYGFLNPDYLFFKNYSILIQKPDSAFYEELHSGLRNDPLATLINSQPESPIYLRMQQEFRFLDSLKGENFAIIKEKGSNLNYKKGDKSLNISHIAQRLKKTGEYNPVVDTLLTDSLYRTLDDEILAAVNRFRIRMSYPEENEIGKAGIDALNRPINYYIDRLRANMERYRWKRVKECNKKNIEVNIAAFKLVATENDSLPLVMNVCVGKPTNKTPVLQSDLNYINLNPKWNVPHSIAKNETLVMQKRDTSYLRKHNMRVYNRDNIEIDPSTLDWNNIKPSSFGYMIKQDAGDFNSLGRIKFMFTNSFSVYMHDTPSKRFFSYRNRAVSHGCVRVQKPLELAFFCLSPISDEYKDRLRYSMDKKVETAEGIKLLKDDRLKKLNDIIPLNNQNISLFIDYYTVYMLPNDTILYYADDVYQYDKVILDALRGIKPVHPAKEKNRKGV